MGDFMKKLLEGVEVEWKSLGEVAEYVRGLTYNKSNESGNNTGYKVIRANNITLSRHTINFDDVKYIKSDTKVKESQKLFKDDILISAASGSREHVGKVAYIFSNLDCYFGGFMGVVRCSEQIKPRFLFHVLTSDIFQKYLDEMLNSSTINNLSSSVMNSFQIPIPPFHVQSEIVRILDNFTELTAKLKAELKARKKQYQFYRDKLLSFEDGEVEWKSLGELTSLITKGTTPKKYTQKGIAFVKTEAFDGTYINTNKLSFIDEETHTKELKRSILKHNDILITIAGATIGKCAIVPKEILPANTNQALAIIRLKTDVNLKYVFHLIKSDYLKKYIEQNIKGSAQPNLNLEQLNNFCIPVPSPEEQARIVSILDKFDTLTNSISEGLPREIKLRQQQYEYYRNMLLTFPKDEEMEPR